MTDKTILITGCASGIGHAAAVALRAAGWRVFASCKQAEDCARLRNEGFDSPQINYSDSACIEAGLADVLEATGGTLDALYNNGAIACPGFCEDIPRAALREVFEANVFGIHELTNRVIPVMRAQGHGRIVNCSSILGFMPGKWRGTYVASKYALEGLTDVLRLEMRDTPIKVVLIQPGPITSELRRKSIAYFEKWVDVENSTRAEDYRGLLDRLYVPGPKSRFELPASAAADVLRKALEAPSPRARYKVTTPAYIFALLKWLLPTRMFDAMLLRE